MFYYLGLKYFSYQIITEDYVGGSLQYIRFSMADTVCLTELSEPPPLQAGDRFVVLVTHKAVHGSAFDVECFILSGRKQQFSVSFQ